MYLLPRSLWISGFLKAILETGKLVSTYISLVKQITWLSPKSRDGKFTLQMIGKHMDAGREGLDPSIQSTIVPCLDTRGSPLIGSKHVRVIPKSIFWIIWDFSFSYLTTNTFCIISILS